jgi:hypothetical protein
MCVCCDTDVGIVKITQAHLDDRTEEEIEDDEEEVEGLLEYHLQKCETYHVSRPPAQARVNHSARVLAPGIGPALLGPCDGAADDAALGDYEGEALGACDGSMLLASEG